ncbi:MAG: hypothetical protein JWR05_3536 [Mucilaginibacter sp.]|nr:hypothetical protein [Mucilaginibacter sp.]
MQSIEFLSSKGKGRVTNPNGGSGNYQIFINDYYQGDVLFKDNKWIGHLNKKSELTDKEIQIIGGMIDGGFLETP